MVTNKAELDQFMQFACERLEGNTDASLEDLVSQWREQSAYASTVEDIRQGLMDHVAGLGQPLHEAFDDLRRQLRQRG